MTISMPYDLKNVFSNVCCTGKYVGDKLFEIYLPIKGLTYIRDAEAQFLRNSINSSKIKE